MMLLYEIKTVETVKSFLQSQNYSKRTISAIKLNGALIVNDKLVTVRKELVKGDVLQVHFPPETPSKNLIPYYMTLDVIYEDDYILVVNKLQNQNCAPSREHPHESLVEQVLAYLINKGEQINPHLVTRLDRNTMGLVVFAKIGHVHHLFSKVRFEKEYTCLVYGCTETSNIIEAPITRTNDSIITRHVSKEGRYAKTSYETLKQNNIASLCKVKLHTGRTHQIRVHFKHIGHPLVGDDLYGGGHKEIKGQALQCNLIKFVHPIYNYEILISIDYKQLIKIFNML